MLENFDGKIKPGSEEARILAELDPGLLPLHLAVIMDGNGRWAGRRHLPRVAGHRAGIQSVRETVETTARLGIGHLTLYAFSSENWKRPREEVDTLMGLLQEYIRKELHLLLDNNIRLTIFGRLEDLSARVREEIDKAVEATSGCTGTRLNIALSYGGREEILEAARRLVRDRVAPENIDESTFASRLYSAGQPDPDLLIRTSGEMRLSNFLLWQIAYAELYITDLLWPDFRAGHLLKALRSFQSRERRYGGLAQAGRTKAGE